MIHIVGAGPGAVDLITVRGQKLLSEADVVIYAGSLVSRDIAAPEEQPDDFLELLVFGQSLHDGFRRIVQKAIMREAVFQYGV